MNNIESELEKITGDRFTGENRVVILENGDEIFPAMLSSMDAATESILFLTYVYWEGEIAIEFAKMLEKKAREGVKCYVLLDAHGSFKTSRRLLREMVDAGVILARYNPFRFRNFREYQHRTHRKILVCDGEVGFIGGVGIADNWTGNADTPDNWHDFHFQVEGGAVERLIEAFRQNWRSPRTCTLEGKSPPPLVRSPFTRRPDPTLPREHSGEESNLEIMALISSPLQANSEALEAFDAILQSAEHHVKITSAYLIPDKGIIEMIRKTVESGVAVEIIVPGSRRDSWLAQSSSRASWPELLKMGVKLYLYQPTMCHAKVMIIDDQLVSIGSINFDLVSLRLNEEANFVIKSSDFARRMAEKFEKDKARSDQLTYIEIKRRGWWPRLKESIATNFPLPYWRPDCNY